MGGRPSIISATSFPVAVARLIPSMLWPVARKALARRGVGPMIGRLSQVIGRQPYQVSSGPAPDGATR